MIGVPRWSQEQLAADAAQATAIFRKERLEEPLEDYLDAFDQYQGNVENLFATTVDLTQLDQTALDILTNTELLDVFRYLAGPPISEDDLKNVAEAKSLVATRLRNDAEAVQRIIQVIRI